MVTICDAIMGSGKTTAAIQYMNEHPDKRFIYITPYKSEADRIQAQCPELNFKRPKHQVTQWSTELIASGENIASTHTAFKLYTPEIKELIRERGYTLIIDESIDLMEELDFSVGDLNTCIRAGYVKIEDSEIKLIDDSYSGDDTNYKKFFSILRCRDLLRFKEGSDILYYWLIPTDLMLAFDDVIIMTYMFEHQELSVLLKSGGVEYTYIGLEKCGDTTRFKEGGTYIPEYTKSLRDKVHVLDNEKMNSVGYGDFALSMNWFQKPENSDKVQKLKNNIYNFFTNIAGVGSDQRMWSTYMNSKSKLKGKGYSNSFVRFNARAENGYGNRTALVYALNVYMNVGRKLYLTSRGAEIDDDRYALSTMVQWIWRSAIRNGQDVYIYVPSRRMRTLLINWMNELAEGGCGCET